MANLKISQLPEYTGSTLGSWLIANNSGESETFKIQREDFLNGYALTSTLNSVSSSIATTDLGQNNRLTNLENTYATTSSLNSVSSSIATTDLNQNNTIATLATTASLNALSSSIAVTDLGQNNRLTTIEGRYATTGSNTFVGTETISGSIEIFNPAATSLKVNGGNSAFSGSIIINGSSPSANKYLFFNNNSGSAGMTMYYSPISSGGFIMYQSGSGTINIGSTSGYLNLLGNTTLTGSFTQTGSLTVSGSAKVVGTFTQTGSLTVSGSAHKIIGDTTLTGSVTITGSITNIGTFSNSGSFTQNGATVVTGSVLGNVSPLSISFATASIDLSQANFFTLQLVSGSATHLDATNVKPGQTINVLVSTIGSGSLTFSGNIKQQSGSFYTPTYSTGKDILTLVSFDTQSLYLANAKNFI
jgi:hypothetical protein